MVVSDEDLRAGLDKHGCQCCTASTRREGRAAMAACCMSTSCRDHYVLMMHMFVTCLHSRLLQCVAALEKYQADAS